VARRWRLKKAARIAIIAVASTFVAYLVVANALLRFGGVERFVNESTNDAHLTLGRCHTWFPGRIEVRDLRLRFEDQNVQFELSVARASGKMSLLSLVKKRLHFRTLEADGVRFLFRHKVTQVSGNERRLVHFPRIEGFSDPPMLVPRPPTDKTKDWAFLLENVEARGVELWFMEYRYTGRADVRGAFELAPGRKLWVGPAHADFHPGELGLGKKRPVARDVRGSLDFRFRETNPDPIPGLEIFRQISAKLAFDGKLFDLEAANLYLSDASNTAVRRGAGRLQARVELVDGRFVPDSYVFLRPSEPVHVALPKAALSGSLTTELRAVGRVPARLSVEGSLGDATLNVGTSQPSTPGDVSARVLGARLVTNGADVATPWTVEEASFRIEDGKVPELRALSPPKPIEGGAAWFFARAELAGGAWSGALRADARHVPVRIGGRRSLFDASLLAALESPGRELTKGAFRDVRFEVTSVRRESDEDELRVSLRAPRVEWSDFPPGVLSGRATLEAPRIEPLFEAVGAPPILLSVWPDAPVDATGRFEVGDGLDVRLDLAKSGPFRAMGRLRVCSPAKGAFLVKSGAFSAGLSVRDGTLSIVPLAGEKWLEKNAPECPSDG
jgi:hypothetical protein